MEKSKYIYFCKMDITLSKLDLFNSRVLVDFNKVKLKFDKLLTWVGN